MIRVTSLTVHVPGFALQDVSFTIPAGAVAVVTGPTGAGKTTLLETIAGVRAMQRGAIRLGDVDVSALPPERREVGLVYQHAWLFPHLSVQENVAYGARGRVEIAEVVEVLAIAPLFARPVATLSGGERQLVAIARALARGPQTLLLDEPFAAMDSALRGTIRAVVLDWAARRTITTMLVTHDAAEAALPGAHSLHVANGVVTLG